ncbi:MAG: 50S ribosomal protein L37ae [Candidatus Pacearchaeota archaeon]|nr:50S ribosomal protein L37ae [Candidatus Pacearchaeota archaeon]
MLAIVGKFGPRYGATIRKRYAAIEELQRKKQQCPYCKKKSVKRLAKGLWECKSCEKKFALDAYFLTKK